METLKHVCPLSQNHTNTVYQFKPSMLRIYSTCCWKYQLTFFADFYINGCLQFVLFFLLWLFCKLQKESGFDAEEGASIHACVSSLTTWIHSFKTIVGIDYAANVFHVKFADVCKVINIRLEITVNLDGYFPSFDLVSPPKLKILSYESKENDHLLRCVFVVHWIGDLSFFLEAQTVFFIFY